MNYEVGKPIKPELVNYLKEFTTELDVAEVCKNQKVGFHTLRRLRLGDTKVANSENADALKELTKIALTNAEAKIKDSQKKKKNLTKILDTI